MRVTSFIVSSRRAASAAPRTANPPAEAAAPRHPGCAYTRNASAYRAGPRPASSLPGISAAAAEPPFRPGRSRPVVLEVIVPAVVEHLQSLVEAHRPVLVSGLRD